MQPSTLQLTRLARCGADSLTLAHSVSGSLTLLVFRLSHSRSFASLTRRVCRRSLACLTLSVSALCHRPLAPLNAQPLTVLMLSDSRLFQPLGLAPVSRSLSLARLGLSVSDIPSLSCPVGLFGRVPLEHAV